MKNKKQRMKNFGIALWAMALLFFPYLVRGATWEIEPYLFEFISEKIVGRAIYIEFKVWDERCTEMRPGLSGKVEWGDDETTKLERLNCERWRVPHIYKSAKTYTITVQVEDLTAQIPGVTIVEADTLASSPTLPNIPSGPSTPPGSSTPSGPGTPPGTGTPPGPGTSPGSGTPPGPPGAPPGGPATNPPDFTANFTCNKTELAPGDELICDAALSPDANLDDYNFEWKISSSCESEDFPLEGQGEPEIVHTFNEVKSCYISLSVSHIPSNTTKTSANILITIKEKSAFKNFFDSLLAFLSPPQKQIKRAKQEVAIANVKTTLGGEIQIRLAKNPKNLKIHSCRLNFGDGAYKIISDSDFMKEIQYRYQSPGAYVLALSCLSEKNKQLKSNFGVEIDIIDL